MKIIIMAGGKGTRISDVASDIPKPMIELMGKPLLAHQLGCLARQGFKEVTIVVGHLASKITDYFKDGSLFGIAINYIVEKEALGTAGALFYVYKKHRESIILINGDIFFDVDLNRMVKYHKEKNADATLFTHPNDHPFDSGLLETNKEKIITKWTNKEDLREDYKNRVNAGIHIINPSLLRFMDNMKEPIKLDLDRDILKPAIAKGSYKVASYDSPEYVKDMGTPKRYEEVCSDVNAGIPASKNLLRKQKAFFLDRDGTINEYFGTSKNLFFVKSREEMVLIQGAAEAIKKINNSGYLAIVVTNQPVVARGDIEEEILESIHKKMERLLGEEGAYIDDLIYCPHHPHGGFEGEVAELKIDCECRKPKPGMLLKMAEKYNIDLKDSIMIGDSKSDLIAGKAADCKTGYIERTDEEVDNDLYDYKGKTLFEVVEKVIEDHNLFDFEV